MWNEPTKEELASIPRLFETMQVLPAERIIHLHFFIDNYHWYIAEFDGKDLCFGFVDMDNAFNAKWDYFSLKELRLRTVDGNEIINDPYWQPIKFRDRPQDLLEVKLPDLTLTCGQCNTPFTGPLQIVFAFIRIAPDKTPCCQDYGWFQEKNLVKHIKAILNITKQKSRS